MRQLQGRVPAGLFAASVLACACAAGEAPPHHPPTFEELRTLVNVKLDAQDWTRTVAVLTALKFTPDESKKIRDSNDVQLLLGASSNAASDDDAAFQNLRLALAKAPEDPVVLAAFAYRALWFLGADGSKVPELPDILRRWRRLEPQNSVPAYLEVARCVRLEQYEAAAHALVEATPLPKFITHNSVLHMHVVSAAEFVGYTKFQARFLSLASMFDEMNSGMTAIRCMRWEGANENVARNLLALGRRAEAASTLFIGEMSAFTAQRAALKKLPDEANEKEMKRISDRIEYIRKASDRLVELHAIVPEKRGVEYFDEVFATSEAQAYEKLAAEYAPPMK